MNITDRVVLLPKWLRDACFSKIYSSSPSDIPPRPAPVPSLPSGSLPNALCLDRFLDSAAGFLRDKPLWLTRCDGEARDGSLPLALRIGAEGSWYGSKVAIPVVGWEGWESNSSE